MKISWNKDGLERPFLKYRLGALLLAVAMFLGGCNPGARARDWAKTAENQVWHARYRLVFHQKDGDLEMRVLESRGETLTLDIEIPRGSLRLEYGSDSLLLNLDAGNLEWQDIPRQIPYYTLTALARQITAALELETRGEWAELLGYRLRVKGGAPTEAGFLSEWTLYVEEFVWE